MQSKYAALLAFSLLTVVPALTMAHGGEAREAMPKHDMKGMDKSHKVEGAGHASALGKAADVKRATRTIEIVMGDNMRHEQKKIHIKQG